MTVRLTVTTASKRESLKKLVGDDDEEHSGDVHGEDGAHQPPCVVLYIVRLVLNTLCCCSCCQISSQHRTRCSIPHLTSHKIHHTPRCYIHLSFGLFANLPSTTSTSILPPRSRLMLVCLRMWVTYKLWHLHHNCLKKMRMLDLLLTWWSTGSDPWARGSWAAPAQAQQTPRSFPRTQESWNGKYL